MYWVDGLNAGVPVANIGLNPGPIGGGVPYGMFPFVLVIGGCEGGYGLFCGIGYGRGMLLLLT